MAEVASDSEVKLTPTSGKEEGRRSKEEEPIQNKEDMASAWPRESPVANIAP